MPKPASVELQYGQLGNLRRKKHLVKIVEDLASQPGESVPQASPESAATTAAYDFWNSPYFHPKDIRIAHRGDTTRYSSGHDIKSRKNVADVFIVVSCPSPPYNYIEGFAVSAQPNGGDFRDTVKNCFMVHLY